MIYTKGKEPNNMKKYIFTESQIKKIIDNQINEQSGTFQADQIAAINDGSEDFLTNYKKIQGKDLTEKIKKYQQLIGCEVTGHMLDSIECIKQKNRKDFIILRDSITKNKPIYDKIGPAIGKLFNIKFLKQDPESIY
jgi:hypothetical protein